MKFAVDFSVTENGRRKPEYTLDSDLNGEVSLQDFLEWTKSVLIVVADEVLKEEQALGFDKSPIVVVDNKVGKAVRDVNPFGQIEFTSRVSVDQLLIDTYIGIMGRSPSLTGRYKSSNYVFHNGQQVATDEGSLKSWLASSPNFNPTDIIRFVNIQPYGRKLERLGVTFGRQRPRSSTTKNKKTGESRTRLLQPNGTYFLTARAIKSKYKRNSSVRFGFIPGSGLGISASFKTGRPGKNSAGRTYLYPSITIYLTEDGTY